jgi:hypothetical protein
MNALTDYVRSEARRLPSPSPRPSPLGRGRRLRTLREQFVAAVPDDSESAGAAEIPIVERRGLRTVSRRSPAFQRARTLLPLPKGEGRGEGEGRADASSASLISLALARSQGGAATPPYPNMVGRTCRSAVEFRKQAQRRLRPGTRVPSNGSRTRHAAYCLPLTAHRLLLTVYCLLLTP